MKVPVRKGPNIKEFFEKVLDIYSTAFGYIKYQIREKILKKVIKYEPKQYIVPVEKLPPSDREKIIVQELLKEREQRLILEEKLKQLEEELNKTRQEAFGKVLEEFVKLSLEKGEAPISLYYILSRARARGLLPFRKPPVVFDITMNKLGYLKDIVLHPNGGFAFVIYNPVTKREELTPPFMSLFEAVYHPENISKQLPDTLVLNVVEIDGRLVKVPEHLINMLYKGEPVEKIVSQLYDQIRRLSSELENTKLINELLSIQSNVNKIDTEVAKTISTVSLNLFENTMNTISKVVVPIASASLSSSTIASLEIAHQRSLAEHSRDIANEYANRLKTLEQMAAPERLVATQQSIIENLTSINKTLAEIFQKLSGLEEKFKGKEEKK